MPKILFMRGVYSVVLLIASNIIMTFAWYGHLKFREYPWFARLGMFMVILFSWGLAFFEYLFQVPANRLGYKGNGGPFSLVELKVIQEVVSLLVFSLVVLLVFKGETLRWNHFLAFGCLVLAVIFMFWGRE